MNTTMQEIDWGHGLAFAMWSEFCDTFFAAFKRITKCEEVRQQLWDLKQIDGVVVQRATVQVALHNRGGGLLSYCVEVKSFILLVRWVPIPTVIYQQHKQWQRTYTTTALAQKETLGLVMNLVPLLDGHQDRDHEEEWPRRKGGSM